MSLAFAMTTQIVQGKGCIEELSDRLKMITAEPGVLICTDKGIVNSGIAAKITAVLEAGNIKYEIFDEIVPNPRVETVEKGGNIFKEKGLNVLVAIGGGSSIDTAKAISAVVSGGGEISNYEGRDKLVGSGLPLVAVPTTYGTGSEANKATLVTDLKANKKMVIVSQQLQPLIAFLDPSLMVNLPPRIASATAVDALTHAIESYCSVMAQPISDALNLYAIKLISENAPVAALGFDQHDATANVLTGSTMAGMAFGNTGLGLTHAISHALGGITDLPHGVLNAILIPHVMNYNLPVNYKRYKDIGVAMGLSLNEETDIDAAKMACQKVYDFCRLLEIPERLRDVGIKESIFEQVSEAALKDGNYLRNRRAATVDEIKVILEDAF